MKRLKNLSVLFGLLFILVLGVFLNAQNRVVAAEVVNVAPPCNLSSTVSHVNANRSHAGDNSGYAVDLGLNKDCSGSLATASISGNAQVVNETCNSGSGTMPVLIISNPDTGVKVKYGHVIPDSLTVYAKDGWVNVGDPIISIGSIGCGSTGAHIHFEVWKNNVKQRYANWQFIYQGVPTPGDYEGDGVEDISLKFHDGRWLVDYSNNGYLGWDVTFTSRGGYDAVPTQADYDKDGKTDLSVKTIDGRWLIDKSSIDGFGYWDTIFNGKGDVNAVPTIGDYDGDTYPDISVKHLNGTWYIDRSNNGFTNGVWDNIFLERGGADAIPAQADYDGDKKTDMAVKVVDGRYLIDNSRNGFDGWITFNGYGGNDVLPFPGDYDGDGKSDIAVKTMRVNEGGTVTGGRVLLDYSSEGTGTLGFGGWNRILNGYGGSNAFPVRAKLNLSASRDSKDDITVFTFDKKWWVDFSENGFGYWDQNHLPADF